MAMNPMQRRARNSFLVGFLVAIIIMALVVVGLLYQIKLINEAKEKLEARQINVYVASEDLKSGDVVTLEDNFIMSTVQSTINRDEIISDEDFQFLNENGDIIERFNDDGSVKVKEMMMKIDVPAGTIVTKDMIVESGEEVTDSQRIQEFNMISLPSQLKNGEYIDIRLALPNGQDFIVLSKKKVLGCTETSVWLKLDEIEILTMNNAIVEAYTVTGSKLHALPYIEAGMQTKATPTYTPSASTIALIDEDPNITRTAREALWARYGEKWQDIRNNYFESALNPYKAGQDAAVEAGFEEEAENIRNARKEFVESLEETGEDVIGYKR